MKAQGIIMDIQALTSGHNSAIEETVKPLLIESQNLCKEHRILQKDRWRVQEMLAKRRDVWAAEQRIRAAIRPFAKASCLPFCEDVCRALPRELKDVIYSYIHAHDTIYVGPEYFEKKTRPCESDPKAHYWDAEYVGNVMRNEIVESWYRTTRFYFYDKANNAKVTERFLITDRWGLGIKPQNFICHARIELSMDNAIHVRWGRGPCCTVENAGKKLVKPLKNFDCLPNNVEFFIRIHTYGAPHTGCMSMMELRNAIKFVVDELETLFKAGHRVVIQWPDLDNIELSWKDRFIAREWVKQLELAAHLTPSDHEKLDKQAASDD